MRAIDLIIDDMPLNHHISAPTANYMLGYEARMALWISKNNNVESICLRAVRNRHYTSQVVVTLRERHDSSDLDTKTQDKIRKYGVLGAKRPSNFR
mgnify:CR=1 FL=1